MSSPDESEEWLDPIFAAVMSDIQACGWFDYVNLHEPKRKPGKGLNAFLWVQGIKPMALASGLAATSARVVFTIRCFSNMFKEPLDLIDPNLTKAVSSIMRRYHGNFDFGGIIRNVDLLGHFGVELDAVSGYTEIDGTLYRIMDITVPCIVNDVWPQVTSP